MTEKQKIVAEIASRIAQGLLASGRYLLDGEDDGGRIWTTIDNGEDWKENVFPKRFTARVVIDAVELAEEMIYEIEGNVMG